MDGLSRLVIKVSADMSDLDRKMSASMKAISNLGAQVESVGKRMSIGLTVPVIALGGVSVKAAAEMDSLKRSLTAITGSTAETGAQLARLQEVAKMPGLGFREAIQGSVRLQAVRIEASMAERMLKAFGNAVSLAGGGKAELDGVALAIQQIAGKGKVAAEEINQLAERAPQVRAAMQDAFGTADTEAIQKMGLSTNQFFERLIAQLEKLPRATGGVSNSFENLSDNLFRARVAIGDRLLPVIVPLTEGLANLLSRTAALNTNTVHWGISIAGVAAAIGPALVAIGSLATATRIAAVALGTNMLPLIAVGGPLILGAMALSAVLVKNKLDSLAAASAAAEYAEKLRTLTEAQAMVGVFDLADRTAAIGKELAKTPVTIQVATAAGGLAPVENPEYKRLSLEQQEITRQSIILAERLAELRGKPGSATAPVISTALTDQAESALGRMTDQLREMHRLSRFGLLRMEDAPDVVRQALNHLSGLEDRVRSVREDLKGLGASAPAGANTLLSSLESQAVTARAEVDRLVTAVKSIKLATSMPAIGLASGFTERPTMTSAAEGATPYLRTPYENLGVGRLEGLGKVARTTNIWQQRGEQAKDAGGVALNSLAGGALKLLNAFNPLTLLASAFGKAMEPIGNMMARLGGILSSALMPILEALWPVFKLTVIGATYLGQIFFTISGHITKAVGVLVEGLGILVDKLVPDWISTVGKGLAETGRDIQHIGDGFKEGADELGKAREEIKGLTWKDATAPLAGASREAAHNISDAFNADRRRLEVTGGLLPRGAAVAQSKPQIQATTTFAPGSIVLHAAPGENPEEFGRRLLEAIGLIRSRGGATELDMAILGIR